MVYLICPRCNEKTEHELLTISDTKIFARCTECLVYWRAPYGKKEIYYDERDDNKKEPSIK